MHTSLGLNAIPVSSRPRVREISSLPSWVACFLTFLAVGTSDPVTRERLAYAILIIREAMRHGGMGWLDYDRLFRQQAALDPSLEWNTVHPSLQATTILSQRHEQGSTTGPLAPYVWNVTTWRHSVRWHSCNSRLFGLTHLDRGRRLVVGHIEFAHPGTTQAV